MWYWWPLKSTIRLSFKNLFNYLGNMNHNKKKIYKVLIFRNGSSYKYWTPRPHARTHSTDTHTATQTQKHTLAHTHTRSSAYVCGFKPAGVYWLLTTNTWLYKKQVSFRVGKTHFYGPPQPLSTSALMLNPLPCLPQAHFWGSGQDK